MGNQTSLQFLGDGGSNDYSDAGSFGQAFHAAHSVQGPGSVFIYGGKSYTTDCADGGNYRTQPILHTYTKNSFPSISGQFATNERKFDARSGMHPFQTIYSGEIPNGTYRVSGTSDTGGVHRYKLQPITDIGNRTHLQIHQKNDQKLFDTRGCISVDKEAMKNIKVGDTLKVSKKK